MEPIIRKMTSSDWEGFHVMDKVIFPDDMLSEEWMKKRVERDGCFVLELEDVIIGELIVSRFGEDEGHLGRIGVDSDQQGRGFSKSLMKYAIEWFQDQGDISNVHLYTQHDNIVAQGLYRKFGFEMTGTTWHFFVPFDSLEPQYKYVCQEIEQTEIDPVGALFESLPAAQIERFLSYDEYKVLTLKDEWRNIVGVCRFTPDFPGCFPFEIVKTECFDDFILGVKNFCLPEFDYVRVTFTDMYDLAGLCEQRNYKLHHKLYKMSLTL